MFTYPMALALVGSVGTVCLTLTKILVKSKKLNKDGSNSDISELKQHIAVQSEQIKDLKEDVSRLQDNFDKLNDLLIRFLSN